MTADSAQQSKGRSRPASRYVAIVMIVAALVSALLIGAYNYYNGRALLGDAVDGQLVDVATNRAQRIEVGLQSLADLAATYATEPSVAAALVDLSAASAMTAS